MDILTNGLIVVFADLLGELWRVFKTGIGRGKPHDGDILKLR